MSCGSHRRHPEAIVASALQSPWSCRHFRTRVIRSWRRSAAARPDVRRSAFDALVTAYWKPVFKYVRLKWHASPDDAADLTQGFFLRAFEKDFFAGFDPSRARFRTYLRTCLDGYVVQRAKGGRAVEAGRRRDAGPDRRRRSRARAAASGDQRDRRLRRLLPPRVAARPVRGRGGAPARRLRRARARRAFHRVRAVRSGRRRTAGARPTPIWRGVSACRRST